MRKIFSSSPVFLLFAALALTVLGSFYVWADTPEAVQKKMKSMNDAHREMFATRDFAKLDKEMNGIQAGYEKGQWTDAQLLGLFVSAFGYSPMYEDFYNKWVAAFPKSYAANYARGEYYFGLAGQYASKPDKAAEQLRVATASLQDLTVSLSLTPKPLLTDVTLMGLYAMTKDMVKVKAEFDTAMKLDPRGIVARISYMAALSVLGTTDEMQAVATDLRKGGQNDNEITAAIKLFHVRLFREARYDVLDRELNQIQRNYEDGKITDEILQSYFSIFFSPYAEAEGKLDAWIKAYPNSYAARQARCSYFLNAAGDARGEKYIKDTSAKELAGMELYLKRAADDCTAAEPLTKKPILSYVNLMQIAEYGGGRETSKQMLDLANLADPKNVVARKQYMHGLQPQWGGSVQQMKDFMAQSKLAGVSDHGIASLNHLMPEAVDCDICNGTEAFAKIGTVETGF